MGRRNLSSIFRRNFGYRLASIRYSPPIIDSQEYRQKIGKIVDILAKYRWSIDKSKINREWWNAQRSRRTSTKNRRFSRYIVDKIAINRRFSVFFLKNLWNLIQRPYLNFWGSDDPDFTRVFVKASNGQFCDPMVENQSSLGSNGYEVFPTVIWRSNGEIWTKIWFNG